ncbi:hypothetical protein M8312_11905 [Sphingomonas sp. KRR8]|uniref:hypothetical protein n=1 Tax=Sphingomonas sp. KRR8 TaxID=2942996 RepID=UPI0020216784|nr:hypothetical protein [Sphingomonas sp. KRR8]URD60480.1 hypothetical protein M8312_11905 [Sphingomonas sp. KRR8]
MGDNELFALAATGNVSAVLELANRATASFALGVPEAIGGAEVLFRLAAAMDQTFQTGLAGFLLGRGQILTNAGEPERGEALRNEAIGILKGVVISGHPDGIGTLAMALQCLADDGDEQAALELNQMMEALSAETAGQIRSDVADAMKLMETMAGQ